MMEKDNDSPPALDDDRLVLIPVEDYFSLMRSLDKLEQARDEFRKIGKNIKPLENGKVDVES